MARKAVAFAHGIRRTRARLEQDFHLVRDLVQGKAREHLVPLAQRLLGRAVFENDAEAANLAHDHQAIAAE